MQPALVIGVGGSNRPESLTERLLQASLARAEQRGARTVLFDGAFLSRLPIFGADDDPLAPEPDRLIKAVAAADGLLIASPGYHGGLSGLVKNGLDHLEALRADSRPYLDGRPVGTIVTAAGWLACGTALVSLRSTVHALRGWPTPFGATVNSAEPFESATGDLVERVSASLAIVADQVMDFLGRQYSRPGAADP
jgi:FMN reductase